ncbi:MAG TPA: diacylglycerol kinase family protein [Rhizomicrobium sp.]|nr:diacylglycerol kinase family protein [Rhizomicrobium sp.]
MNPNPAFTVAGRLKSFRHAFAGIGLMLRTQHNAWLHLAATAVVIAAGLTLHISAGDWRWLVVAIVLVWVSEAMNTAFEHLCDVVSPDFHASVKLSKDIAAGAVLITAIGALVIGALVFLPYL